MQRIFSTLDEFQLAIILFEARIEMLDQKYKTFILITTVGGEAISSLNDLVRVEGIALSINNGLTGVLHFFTSGAIPKEIKSAVEIVFDSIFYNAD